MAVATTANEYEAAADILRRYIFESGYEIPIKKSDIEEALDEFNERFSPDKLAVLPDDKILSTIFTSDDGSDTLCYWLEYNKNCKAYFGSISGGSAFKLGLFRKKETGKWMTGSSQKPFVISESSAIGIGTSIRNMLVQGVNILRNTPLKTLKDYEALDNEFRALLGDYYGLSWIHKYFSMVCPDKLSCYHSTEWQKHVLYSLCIKPSEGYYARSGQIAMIENKAGWYYDEFGTVFYRKFGGPKKFVRIGTTDGGDNKYADEWASKSIIAIGWGDIGPLENYIVANKLDRNSITYNLEETYYPSNKKVASRKAGEIIKFYETDSDTVFVAMDGGKLIALLDNISGYYYDNSTDMSHIRSCKWHPVFSGNENLPVDEGKLTTCHTINIEENLRYLYQKYYYGNEVISETQDENETTKNKITYNTKIQSEYERNRIVFGAPGTGKSYRLKTECESFLAGTSGAFERVTFHPDYSYAQFVGTYKPVTDEDGKSIRYEYIPGPFMRVLAAALKSAMTASPQPYVLIIEEINRAKSAAVFGDVFQLLDRDGRGVSEYEIQASEDIRKFLSRELDIDEDECRSLKLPDNMFIWATMNSADQGVYPMDTAFKRRWDFEYIDIDESEKEISDTGRFMLGDEIIEWNILRKAINAKMISDEFRVNEDKLLGPFFLSDKLFKSDENGMIINTEKFFDSFKSKVLMYLYEDAVKQKRRTFFDLKGNSGYSSLCKEFDKNGLSVFGDSFKSEYYDKIKDKD